MADSIELKLCREVLRKLSLVCWMCMQLHVPSTPNRHTMRMTPTTVRSSAPSSLPTSRAALTKGHRVRMAHAAPLHHDHSSRTAELRLNKPHIRFFEVLAPFYCTVR